MMISHAVLLFSVFGILNMTGRDPLSSEQVLIHDLATMDEMGRTLVAEGYFHPCVEYPMPVIEPSPGSQYHILSVRPDASKDYKIHVIDPDSRMGKTGVSIPDKKGLYEKYKKGK